MSCIFKLIPGELAKNVAITVLFEASKRNKRRIFIDLKYVE